MITTFTYEAHGSDYTFADVAIMADGSAFLSGNILPGWSGWTNLFRLDTVTGTVSVANYSTYQGGSLTASDSREYVMFGQLGLSSAEYSVFDQSGNLVANNGIYENGVYGYAAGIDAFSGVGADGRVAIYTGGLLHLYDGNMDYLDNISLLLPEIGSVGGLAFDASGENLFVLDATRDAIVEIRLADRSIVRTIQMADFDYAASAWGSEITVADDGTFLLVQTTDGIVRVGLGAIIEGTAQDDRLDGSAGQDYVSGLAGNDVLNGFSGDDTLSGGSGQDLMYGGAGDDLYIVDNAGDHVIERFGEGYDAVETSITYRLSANVEDLVLTGGAAIGGTGNILANTIAGNDAANTLNGHGGDDVLIGGRGDDILIGGLGNDAMRGGIGDDGYRVDAAGDSVVELAGEGYDTVVASVDYTFGDNVEKLGLIGRARVGTGNTLDNLILGGGGADTLSGLDGNDSIQGNDGADKIDGGAGDDLLYGGLGRDLLAGGTGADRFVFRADDTGATAQTADRIADFSHADGDRISLAAIDANEGAPGNAFVFVGTAAFSGAAGELRYSAFGSDTLIEGDTDGDGIADLAIRLAGDVTLVAGDFVL